MPRVCEGTARACVTAAKLPARLDNHRLACRVFGRVPLIQLVSHSCSSWCNQSAQCAEALAIGQLKQKLVKARKNKNKYCLPSMTSHLRSVIMQHLIAPGTAPARPPQPHFRLSLHKMGDMESNPCAEFCTPASLLTTLCARLEK
jgi:hypothetical protein